MHTATLSLVRALCAAALCLAAALPAQALEARFVNAYRALTQDYYQGGARNSEPLLPPGDVALIDDWWLNTTISFSGATVGDSLGVRATSPTGSISETIASRGTDCWMVGMTTWCPALISGWWDLGVSMRFGPVGQWRFEVLKNNEVIHTFNVQLKPYLLDFYSQSTQSIPVRSVTPLPLAVVITRPDGLPAGASKQVTFTLTSKPGGANPPGGIVLSSSYTGQGASTMTVPTAADGTARVWFETGGKAGTYVVTATAPTAPGVSRTFTIQAQNTDPLQSATAEKNLGGDPANNSSCPRATSATEGNPVNVATGNKTAEEVDYEGSGVFPLRMVRYYNSMATRGGSFGPNWRGFYDRSLVFTTTTVKNKSTTTAEAVRPDGRVLRFRLSGGAWLADPDIVDRLESIGGGGYRFVCANDQVETYGSTGRLVALSAREGFAQALAYDAQGRLAQVMDAFGRTLALQYDANGRAVLMTDPAGRNLDYSYSASGNLVGARYPDQALRQYHYENASFPRALTGITDENGSRFASYDYDAQGRAWRTTHAGGAGQRSVYYYTDGRRDVLDAAGNTRRYGFSVIQGVDRRTSLDNGACASCGNAVMSTGYSSSGFVASLIDYRGTQTTFVRDARGLETSRTEAAGQAEARTIATTWHASWRLPLTVTRPGQQTRFSYDTAGRMTGRTIVDTASGASRSWTYAYNAQGLLASIDGPRTDVADITRFGYDTQGNLVSATNALGHVTRFTAYDAHGRPLSMTDPNGLVTSFAYDLRGRLTSRNVGGRITSYLHDAAGRLLRVTRADGSAVEHQYDAAHRLVGSVDSGGHRVAYTLDGEGRVLRQEHFDATGTSTYARRFSYDAMGHVLTEIDSGDRLQRRFQYDANGNRVADLDAFGVATTFAYDRLDRLSMHTNAANGTTVFAYDGRDNLLRVTDPVGVATTYAYDGLDNRVSEASADVGTHGYTHDSAGNLRVRTWPNGRSATIAYDALDRPTQEDYGSGVQVGYQYDTGSAALGRLVGMTDPAGSTAWAWDAWGGVLQKRRSTGVRQLITGYAHDGAGRLASLTYPSGRTLGYTYDAGGRPTSISLDGAPLVDGIDWLPFGPPRAWTQATGRRTERVFDRDGRLSSHNLESSRRQLFYDEKGRVLRANEWYSSSLYGYDAADRLTSQSFGAQSWAYAYDGNGNRASQTTPGGSTVYAYSGNRLVGASGAEARSVGYDAAGNTTSDGAASYAYDARNRLAQAPGAAFGYDGSGSRVYKSTTGSSRYYAHDLDRRLLGEYDDTGPVYETVWLGSTPLAVLKAGQRFWVDADQIDTPRAVLNDWEQTVWRWPTEAFGNSVANEDPSGLGPFEFNLRFPGQVFDRETALNHNDHRDYSPRTGRYLEADPIGLWGGTNTFAYAIGNPVGLIDPDGLDATVCLYPGAATAGHVGIGINSSSTVGLYPRSESPGISAITGTPAAVRTDTKAAEQCKTIITTPEQDSRMRDLIARVSADPGTYRLTGNNCTNFVRSVLKQAGIPSPSSPGPRPFFEDLPGKP